MTAERNLRIDGHVPPVEARRNEPGASDSTGFRRMLERLERLAERPRAPEVTDASALRDALREAEDGFRSAMDLRRSLEEAFRARSQER